MIVNNNIDLYDLISFFDVSAKWNNLAKLYDGNRAP